MEDSPANKLLDRFMKYVRIDSRSDPYSNKSPSTKGQMELAHTIKKELEDLQLQDISLDSNGYLMATLPSNIDKTVPVIGFIAHLDTSPDMTAQQVTPKIIENYDGGPIQLHPNKKLSLDPGDFPKLLQHKGETLIVTNGNTLLGADDKAGIAEIITAMEYFSRHPEIPHGTIRIGFTPDEEIARGANHFDPEKFGADFAYTVDGGELGELEYETFNAAEATIDFKGYNMHPGYAKNRMINALQMGIEFNQMLPESEKPEYTENYEGYYHLIECSGSVDKARLRYLIRDHDSQQFNRRKTLVKNAAKFLNFKYGKGKVRTHITDQYYNMKEILQNAMQVVDLAREAMKESGIQPDIKPIRGGTDGARLSHMGLPCPNIFTGGYNFHSPYEYASLQSMQKAVAVLTKIIEIHTTSHS